MPARAIIPAAISASNSSASSSQPFVQNSYPHSSDKHVSYGATESPPSGSRTAALGVDTTIPEDEEASWEEGSDTSQGVAIDVTWRYVSRMYLLVPIITLLFFTALVLLVVFAWPPSKKERRQGQTYPHPFLFWPFLTGIFASCTVQVIRVPIWTIISWVPIEPGWITFFSTALHSTLHELIRFSTLPMIHTSPSSGFHSSYYLGLGFGAAEVTWGIIQGWEQMALYEDVMRAEVDEGKIEGLGLINADPEEYLGRNGDIAEEEDEEAELERKVEILDRMRSRRALEEVIGVPYPNIPIACHLLWRLDGLMFNLGLTLILSSFYFNPIPIYRHHTPQSPTSPVNPPATVPSRDPSQWVWLVWGLIVLLHVCVSLVWKIVGRVGIGAVTWGGLIVALGTVFAGLGGWGGLV